MLNTYEENEESELDEELQYTDENTVVQYIQDNIVIAACNTAVYDNVMASYSKVSN